MWHQYQLAYISKWSISKKIIIRVKTATQQHLKNIFTNLTRSPWNAQGLEETDL
jgi:hypothetical protein